jgi:histidinol dehydrogenase
MLPIIRSENQKGVARFLALRDRREAEAAKTVRHIIDAVRKEGDAAVARLTKHYDRTDLRETGFTVPVEEIQSARRAMGRQFLASVRQAARNIGVVARRQLPRAWTVSTRAGVKVGQVIRPLDCVACYVPGGRFPLPSTVLMSVIPAQAAGVKKIFITTPRPAPAVLAVADLLGVSKIFRLGGAQAIAAFAYGTETVPRADKIVGPGNRFVAAAKKALAGECGIDFVAGPTELVVVGSRGCANWIASDLIAQAEHDPDASAVLITPSIKLALQVQQSVGKLLTKLRLELAETSLASCGAIVVTRTLAEAIEWANRLAPEHLTLLDDAVPQLRQVRSAGAIFLGGYSPVAAGDYASGGNHILPTGGVARIRGGLSAADFVKAISVQQFDRKGLADLRHVVVTLAETEGLRAHAHSVDVRFADDPRA